MSEPEIIPAPQPFRGTMIKGLIPALPERGKIKIGAKGVVRKTKTGTEFQPPQKLDHFVITTLARGADNNFVRDEQIHERLGSDKPTEIPVRLVYDDPTLNFPTRYAAYWGRTLWCSGDGETALRLKDDRTGYRQIGCPCPLADPTYEPGKGDPPRCKMNGSLSVIIDGASRLGGVWKFRTTSWNSINRLMSSMVFLRDQAGGILAGLPLILCLQQKQAENPKDKSPVLIYFVTLEYDGDEASLQSTAHQIALDRAMAKRSMVTIEHEARRLLELAAPADAPLPGDDAEDVRAEFYPETYEQEADERPTRAQFRKSPSPSSQLNPNAPMAAPVEPEPELPEAPQENQPDPKTPRGEQIGEAEDQKKDPDWVPEDQSGDGEPWDVTYPDDGEVRSYGTPAEAEMAFMKILNEGLRKALNAKPGSTLAKSIEAAVESNDELLKTLPRTVYDRLSDRIAAAIAQVSAAHAGGRAKLEKPKQPDAIGEALAGAATGTYVRTGAGGPISVTAPRDIEIKTQLVAPGRGRNWTKMIDDTIAMIGGMTVEELTAFPTYGANAPLIAQLKLMDSQTRQISGKEPVHWSRIEAALAARSLELYGGTN